MLGFCRYGAQLSSEGDLLFSVAFQIGRHLRSYGSATAAIAAMVLSCGSGEVFAAPVAGPQPADERVEAEQKRDRAARADTATTEERDRRLASRRAFRGLSASEALELAKARHPEFALLPAWRAFATPVGHSLLGYENDFAARIGAPDGTGGELVVANVPLRAVNDAGQKRPVDLSLQREGDAFQAANPLAGIRLSTDLDDGLRLSDIGLVVRPTISAQHEPTVSGDTLFYPNALTDSDVLVRPRVDGFSFHTQLRSEESPEQLAFALDAPADVSFQEARAEGVIEVRRGAELVATITAPVATDADGRPVDLDWGLDGARLEISVPHRGRDYAYPLLVDPNVVESFEWQRYGANNGYGNFAGWNYTGQGNFSGISWQGNSSWLGSGLYIRPNGTSYLFNVGQHGKWVWRAPGFARLTQVEWNLVDHRPEKTEMELGVIRHPVDESAGPSWYSSPATNNPDRRSGAVYDEYFKNCADTCASNDGNPGDEAQFSVVAREVSGYRSNFAAQVGVVYLHLRDVDFPSIGSDLPDGWVDWPSTKQLPVWAVDSSTGISEVRLTSGSWAATVDPDTYGRCQRTYLCPRAHGTDSRLAVGTLPDGINTINMVAKDPTDNARKSVDLVRLTGQGLRGHYHDNSDFTTSKAIRLDPQIDFNWGTTTPSGSQLTSGDHFSVRWTGYIDAPTSGTYKFETSTDDGVRLWVEDLNNPLINDWRQRNASRTGSVWLSAGKHAIVMEYLEASGSAVAKLRWKLPSAAAADPYVAVPAERLSPPAGWQLKLDREPPEVSLGGPLYQLKDSPLTADAWDLEINAFDGDEDGGPQGRRSGVRSIVVSTRKAGDAGFTVVASSEQACPEDSCDAELDWRLLRSEYGVGTHDIKVDVTDWVNHTWTETFAVTVSQTRDQPPPDDESPNDSSSNVQRQGIGGCPLDAENYKASHVTSVVDGVRSPSGYQTTIRYENGSYLVIHCDPTLALIKAQHVGHVPTPDGTYLLVWSEMVPTPGEVGTKLTTTATYPLPDDEKWVPLWPSEKTAALSLVLPPTPLP